MSDRLKFLNACRNLELSWGEVGGEGDDCQWRVHRCSGGHNDREWTLIGHGSTVEAALDMAIEALKEQS